MLQVARLSPNLLGDSSALVSQFLRSQLLPDGGFTDRAGNSDLYYTVFGLESFVALRDDPPVETIAYLERFADGDGLDFVHLACLGRCWATLSHGGMHIAIGQGEPDPDSGVAMVDVDDIKAEAERLRDAGVRVGTVVELAGEMRLVDVFDPDGNRIQLSQPL